MIKKIIANLRKLKGAGNTVLVMVGIVLLMADNGVVSFDGGNNGRTCFGGVKSERGTRIPSN